MRKAALRGSAQRYYALMSPAERQQIDERRQYLEQHPEPDDRTTFLVPELPGLRLFDDGEWRIIYSVPDDATVVILHLRHVFDLQQD